MTLGKKERPRFHFLLFFCLFPVLEYGNFRHLISKKQKINSFRGGEKAKEKESKKGKKEEEEEEEKEKEKEEKLRSASTMAATEGSS